MRIDSPARDARRMDADHFGIEIAVDLLSTIGKCFGSTTHFHAARLPWWQHIVHHKGHTSCFGDITEFFTAAHVVSTDVDCI